MDNTRDKEWKMRVPYMVSVSFDQIWVSTYWLCMWDKIYMVFSISRHQSFLGVTQHKLRPMERNALFISIVWTLNVSITGYRNSLCQFPQVTNILPTPQRLSKRTERAMKEERALEKPRGLFEAETLTATDYWNTPPTNPCHRQSQRTGLQSSQKGGRSHPAA